MRALEDRSRGDHRRDPSGAAGARVLLVDDVVTTGSTLSCAARALRAGGAGDVSAVVAARTVLKRAHRSSDTPE